MVPLGSIVSNEVVSTKRGGGGGGGNIVYQVELQSDVYEDRVENVGTITVNGNLLELYFGIVESDDKEEETEKVTT